MVVGFKLLESMSAEEGARICTVGVIGLGTMGGAIARECARAGLSVVIQDSNAELLVTAACELRALSMAGESVRAVESTRDFGNVDLLIEALPEDLGLKRAILGELDGLLRPGAVLATNTSSLPLAELIKGIGHPERVCGLHFCHPVEERRLVELIVGPRTSSQTRELGEEFARAIGKTPVAVGDGPGFVLNRLLSLYLNEALDLILEGVEPPQLDRVAQCLGMPHGPLEQLDGFGIPVAVAVGRTLYWAFPERCRPSELLIALYKEGRRNKRERIRFLFPSERPGETPMLEEDARRIIDERRGATRQFSDEEVARRLWAPVALEAVRIVEDGLVRSVSEIETVLRLGLGMPALGRPLVAGPEQTQWAEHANWRERATA